MTDDGFFDGCGFGRLNHRVFFATSEIVVIERVEMTDGEIFVDCGFDRLNHQKFGIIAP